ncbi:MAG: hypothetical protein IJ187_11480, partial [Neisseriaceae bacterium]|nr:hypothetical protein [Neisseriaceae bacterium]
FSVSFSFSAVGMVCDYDSNGNRGDCTCFENGVEVLCKCQYKEGCSSLKDGEKCFTCVLLDGSGCFSSRKEACQSVGFTNFVSGSGEFLGKVVCYRNVPYGHPDYPTENKHVVTVERYTMRSDTDINQCDFNGSNDNSDDDNSGPPRADQKKVCSGGECKCYNLTTGKEESCIGGNTSGGGSNSSGDDGSGNTGTGSGSGSGDSGNGQGAGSQGSPSAGNGTNSGAGGDNSGTGTGSNNGDNSGGGTHTGSSGNQHGGGGTGFGGGSSGSNNGSPNGSDDGKEDGSEDGDDYCLKNPKSVVCNGEPKQGDFDDIVIPTKEVKDSWVKDMFLPDNGTCPAPLQANFLGKTISISYEPLCRLLNQVRFAILLLFAYISARLGLGGKL